ncbi:hypothetical protein IMSHALPRED_002347 [Imshaugia aleurites]|uniref:Mid2 domain-containing protein n=1 Tax=Imshaugia aleurites TaxID=172621 RepID=A0A8H3EYX0_9LECA|nr:hypothetical protein IMSHALPRED_002347 [Imshaugia aleurites]
MRAPSRVRYHSRTPCIITSVVLVATLVARTGPATIPTPPSSADKWLYPALNTDPTYNYLDTVNASWTSNFVDPYLLLRCQHPNDTVDYAYPYNQSVSATGSALVPLDDGSAWVCYFQVSDLSTSSTSPPTFYSNDFNIVLNDGQSPVLWTDTEDGGVTAAISATSSQTTASSTTLGISPSSTSTSSITTTPTLLSSATPNPTTTPTTSFRPATSTPSTRTPTQATTSPTPSSATSGLSKSERVAIIVGSTMGALLLVVVAIGVFFILRTRKSGRSDVVYRNRYGSTGIPGSEPPRERWKGVEIPSGQREGYF